MVPQGRRRGRAGRWDPAATTIPLDHNGIAREYVLRVPTIAPPPSGRPLLIQLHGGGGVGAGIDGLTRFGRLSETHGFAVVSPSGYQRNWNDGRLAPRLAAMNAQIDDVGFIAAVIDDIARRVPLDLRRVYSVGISNGAMMTGRLSGQLADRIAAFAQVAGTISADADAWWRPGRPVPVIQIHGTADPLVPYGGGPIGGERRRRSGPLTGRGLVLSVDRWAEMLVANNAAVGPTTATYPPDTSVRAWAGATPQSDIEFWRIEGGGHTWPGGLQYAPPRLIGPTSSTFDASALIWRFLSAHALG